jgi:ATP-binding cassette subfamily B protein
MSTQRNKSSSTGGMKGKFPFYHQHDAMDCGPACLQMIAHAYGRRYSLEFLREHSNVSRRGVNLQGIGDAAKTIGMCTMGIRTTFEKLSQKAQLPCIVHWKQVHFVVVYRIEKKKLPLRSNDRREQVWVHVADPAHGLLKYTEEEFKRCWITTRHEGEEKGIAMLLEPTLYFYEAEMPLNNR